MRAACRCNGDQKRTYRRANETPGVCHVPTPSAGAYGVIVRLQALVYKQTKQPQFKNLRLRGAREVERPAARIDQHRQSPLVRAGLNAPIAFHDTESLANRFEYLRANDRISIRNAYAAERCVDVRRQRHGDAARIERAQIASFQRRLRSDRIGNCGRRGRSTMLSRASGNGDEQPDADDAPEQQRREPS